MSSTSCTGTRLRRDKSSGNCQKQPTREESQSGSFHFRCQERKCWQDMHTSSSRGVSAGGFPALPPPSLATGSRGPSESRVAQIRRIYGSQGAPASQSSGLQEQVRLLFGLTLPHHEVSPVPTYVSLVPGQTAGLWSVPRESKVCLLTKIPCAGWLWPQMLGCASRILTS